MKSLLRWRTTLLLISLAIAAHAIHCGKKAAPLPPIIIAPKPPEGLRVRQSGDQMIFSFQLPTISTDDKTPADVTKIEIYRLKEPRIAIPTQTQPAETQTQPVLQTEPVSEIPPQAQTQPETETETETMTEEQTQTETQTQPQEQTQTQTQTQSEEQTETQTQSQPQSQTQSQSQTAPVPQEQAREISGAEFKSRSDMIAELTLDQIDGYMREGFFYFTEKVNLQPDSEDLKTWFYYGVKVYNARGKASGFSSLAALFPAVVAQAPANFTAVLAPGEITFNWTPVTADLAGKPLTEGSVGYVIFRGSNANFAPEQALTPEPVTTTSYVDNTFEYGQPYYYFIRTINLSTKKSQQSPPSNVLFMFPQDTFAPKAPAELNVVAAREGMVLIWSPNEEDDVAGYNIYRSTEPGKDYKKVNPSLVRETTYTDEDIRRKQRYYYVVTAVDSAPTPNESEFSNEISEMAKPQ